MDETWWEETAGPVNQHPTEYFDRKVEGPVNLDMVEKYIEYIYDVHTLVDLELVPVTNALEALAAEVKALRRQIHLGKMDLAERDTYN